MPAAASAETARFLPDMHFILINRLSVLAATLLFFLVVFIVRYRRRQAILPRIVGPIKLSLFGFLLQGGEVLLSGIPAYSSFVGNILTVVVLLCLAKMLMYLIVDIYMPFRTRHEVPSFLRDAFSLVVYLAVAVISLRLVFRIDVSTLVTTTTVLTAAIAFAMQSTLSNALSGFSIQTDKMMEHHKWIAIKEKKLFGEIINVGFRYTTLRSLDNTLNLVPNSVIMQNVVTYYGDSECIERPVNELDITLGYEMPPESAKQLLMQVLAHDPMVLSDPLPTVRLLAFNDCSISYRLRFCITNPAAKAVALDALQTQIWYAVNREGYSFPFPHRQIISAEARAPFQFSREHVAAALREAELFSMLDEVKIVHLAQQAPVRVFGPGEVVVRQGDCGSSLFIVLRGVLDVSVGGALVGSIQQDSFFGEMSLLTGEPRRATVRAKREVWLAEVTKELMEPLLRENPTLMETLSAILAERERRVQESTAAAGDDAADVSRRDVYLALLKQFFRM